MVLINMLSALANSLDGKMRTYCATLVLAKQLQSSLALEFALRHAQPGLISLAARSEATPSSRFVGTYQCFKRSLVKVSKRADGLKERAQRGSRRA